jgi:hypothetical protein
MITTYPDLHYPDYSVTEEPADPPTDRERAILLLPEHPRAFAFYWGARKLGENLTVALDLLEEEGVDAALEYLQDFDFEVPEVDERMELKPGQYAKHWNLADVGATSLHFNSLYYQETGEWCTPLLTIEHTGSSDYGGGVHSKSNYRVIKKMADEDEFLAQFLVFAYGGYASQEVHVRLDLGPIPETLADVLSGLEDYCAIDEEDWSELEMEEEDEAWERWARDDWMKALLKCVDEDDEEIIEDLNHDQLYELYRLAAERTNTYVEHHSEGPYFGDFDKLTEVIDVEAVVRGIRDAGE